MVVDHLSAKALAPILAANIAKEARLMTDEAGYYLPLGKAFAEHDFVTHGTGEYGRGEVHVNTLEGCFSIFKRGMRGIYQHCGKQHLHRYLAEFDFRYNNRVALGIGTRSAPTWRCLVRLASASPTKRLVRDAEKEADGKPRGSGEAVRGRGPKANRRWRTKPHRG